MQITEQLIERIARRVFNSMFAPALRQSNVQGGGTTGSVRYADEAGHAASADSAAAVPWTGVSDKPATATRWPAWSEVTDKPNFATVATSGSYNDLSNKPSIPSVSGSVSGSTLTININDTSYSLTDTNTWRPIGTGSNDAAAGNHLHDGRYLKLEGGNMTSGARINFSGGDGYLGNAGNEGWLMVQDICSQSGRGETYWAIHTNGQAVFTKMTSKTSNKALSDARHKDVKRGVELTVEQIAAMPAVIFEWLDKDLRDVDPGEHVGTLAQAWQKILPQSVSEQQDGTLTMGYGEAALVSVITLARRVLKLARRMLNLSRHVLRLERRVSKLEKEIEELKKQKECH